VCRRACNAIILDRSTLLSLECDLDGTLPIAARPTLLTGYLLCVFCFFLMYVVFSVVDGFLLGLLLSVCSFISRCLVLLLHGLLLAARGYNDLRLSCVLLGCLGVRGCGGCVFAFFVC